MTTETTNQTNSNAIVDEKKTEAKPVPAKKNLPFHQLQHNHRGGKFGASAHKGGKGMNVTTRRGGSGGDR